MAVAVQPRGAAFDVRPYAGFWIRVLAFLVDGFAIGVIVSAVTLFHAGASPEALVGPDWNGGRAR
jgi:hypothetical protein